MADGKRLIMIGLAARSPSGEFQEPVAAGKETFNMMVTKDEREFLQRLVRKSFDYAMSGQSILAFQDLDEG